MPIATTYLSLHDVLKVTAAVGVSYSTPLVLELIGPDGVTQITVHLRKPDVDYVHRLANSINGADTPPEPSHRPIGEPQLQTQQQLVGQAADGSQIVDTKAFDGSAS